MTNSLTSPTDRRPATARGPAVTLAVAGALLATGGLLHPSGPWTAQLVDLRWIPAHAVLLLGAVAATVALFLLAARLDLPRPVRTGTGSPASGPRSGPSRWCRTCSRSPTRTP